jgi:hypothetical protein
MKYTVLLISLLLCSSTFSFSQRSAYYDALYLKSQLDTLGSIRVEPSNRELFNFYFGKLSDDAMEESIEKNPFLLKYYKSEQAQGLFNALLPKKLSSIGGLNVTNFADGLARFLIERGKQELNVAFFNRLEKFLDSTEECKVLFSESVEIFKTADPYEYSKYIEKLRDAFQKDLSNLIVSLNQLIELPKYRRLLKELPEIRLAIRSARIVQELSQSKDGILPDSIISKLSSLNEWGEIDFNLGNSWKLLNVISQSVRYIPDSVVTSKTVKDTAIRDRTDTTVKITRINNRLVRDTTVLIKVKGDTLVIDKQVKTTISKDSLPRIWISLSDMHKLIEDSITLRIFLGLVYQKADTIRFRIKDGDSISVQNFMRSYENNILGVFNLIENFVTLANEVDGTIKDLTEKKKNNLLSNEDYYTYINKAINIIEYGFKAANTIYKFKATNQDKPDLLDNRYIRIAKNGNELYKGIYSKSYNNAIMSAYNIIELTFNHKDELIEEKIRNLDLSNEIRYLSIDSLRRLNTANSLDDLGKAKLTTREKIESVRLAVQTTQFPSSKVIGAILKYGNFMASVVKAESGEDVQKALEAAALPAGSYSVKQKSEINISINGYIGYAWDFNKVSFKDTYAKGVYAPVGINITHGSTKKHGLTFTGFISLLDVGSVAAYRLHNGTTETLKQEVRLESIFSPSAQLIVEVGGYPFAVAAGWRRTPRLFYSNNTSFTTILPKNVFNFSVLIDIPIFTIYNKQFDKK